MDAFEAAAGISMVNLNYIIAPLLVVGTIIIVSVGLIEALKAARTNPEVLDLSGHLIKGLFAVIAAIALVYFMTQNL